MIAHSLSQREDMNSTSIYLYLKERAMFYLHILQTKSRKTLRYLTREHNILQPKYTSKVYLTSSNACPAFMVQLWRGRSRFKSESVSAEEVDMENSSLFPEADP